MKFSPSSISRSEIACGLSAKQCEALIKSSVDSDIIEHHARCCEPYHLFQWETDRSNSPVFGAYLMDQQEDLLCELVWVSPFGILHQILIATGLLYLDGQGEQQQHKSLRVGRLSKARSKSTQRLWAVNEAKDVLSVWSYLVQNSKRSQGSNHPSVLRLKTELFEARRRHSEALAKNPNLDWATFILKERLNINVAPVGALALSPGMKRSVSTNSLNVVSVECDSCEEMETPKGQECATPIGDIKRKNILDLTNSNDDLEGPARPPTKPPAKPPAKLPMANIDDDIPEAINSAYTYASECEVVAPADHRVAAGIAKKAMARLARRARRARTARTARRRWRRATS